MEGQHLPDFRASLTGRTSPVTLAQGPPPIPTFVPQLGLGASGLSPWSSSCRLGSSEPTWRPVVSPFLPGFLGPRTSEPALMTISPYPFFMTNSPDVYHSINDSQVPNGNSNSLGLDNYSFLHRHSHVGVNTYPFPDPKAVGWPASTFYPSALSHTPPPLLRGVAGGTGAGTARCETENRQLVAGQSAFPPTTRPVTQQPRQHRFIDKIPPSVWDPVPNHHPRPGNSASLTIVMEDPGSPESCRKKRQRTKAEGEKRKQDSQLLKESGGACVWCFVNKRKCSPEVPCVSCVSNDRECFRDPSQLSLLLPLQPTCETRPGCPNDPTFQSAHEIFNRLRDEALQWDLASHVDVVINWKSLTNQNTFAASICSIEFHNDGLKRSLITTASGHCPVPSLMIPTVRVVGSLGAKLLDGAYQMFKMLTLIRNISVSRVSVTPSTVHIARMVMFFILTICAIELCETSAEFSGELFEAIRRKELQKESLSENTMNPISIAIGVYNATLKSLIDFQPNHLISGIFQEVRLQLESVQSLIDNLLTNLSHLQTLGDIVPPRPRGYEGFDLAVGLRLPGIQVPTSTAISREEMAHNQLPFAVDSLLCDNFDLGMVGSSISDRVPSDFASLATEDMTTSLRGNQDREPRLICVSDDVDVIPSMDPLSASETSNAIFSGISGYTFEATDLTTPAEDFMSQQSRYEYFLHRSTHSSEYVELYDVDHSSVAMDTRHASTHLRMN